MRQKSAAIRKTVSNALERCRKKLGLQQEKLAEAENADKYRLYGDLITANLYALSGGEKSALLPNYYEESMPLIEIPLDSTKSPQKNSAMYYTKYRKAKTAQEKADLKAEKLYEKTHKRKYRLKPGDIVFNILNYLFFTLFTIACIFPFYYLFINTISDNDLVIKGLINFIPRGIHFDNYTALLNVSDLSSALIVSLSRTVLGTALMVAASGFIGYLVTKDEMWGRKFWYRFLVITMYFNAGLIPWFLNMQMLGLTNTFWAYIIPGIVAPYNIILVKTYIESIPAELEESAQIDGASFFTVFRKIIWPLSKPILATIAIFGAVGHWNSFTDSLILMTSAPKLYTLQHRLYIYLNQASNLSALMESGGSVSEAVLKSAMSGKVIKYTISMVTVIPILIVYPFMQRYFEKGIMLGAVKG